MVTKFNFCRLFSEAWLRTTTPQNVCSGFRKCGVVPFNPDALLNFMKETKTDGKKQKNDDDKEILQTLQCSHLLNCSCSRHGTIKAIIYLMRIMNNG